MSKKTDIERALRGEVYRHGNLVHAAPGERVPTRREDTQLLICGKCGQTFTSNMASEHLKKCQPDGAICAKCGRKFMPDDFIPHFKRCIGRLKEGQDGN